MPQSAAHPRGAGPENRIIRLIQGTQGAGVEVFNFALYPEGEEMVRYNQTAPDACVTHFSSAEVWQAGSALGVIQEFASKIHPEDLEDVSAYIQLHYSRAEHGLVEGATEKFSSERFRGLREDGSWGWYEIRSRLYHLPSGLVITEGVFTEVTELMRLLLIDDLTQLGNRKALERRLGSLNRRTTAEPLELINIDLDDFKSINDSLGQDFGDLVIAETARIVRDHLPDQAALYRLEADEFLVVLSPNPSAAADPAHPGSSALEIARHLQRAISSGFQQHTSLALHLTACCGIAGSTTGCSDARLLIQQANTALWRAKQERSANICVYSDAISTEIQSRLELKRTIDHALRSGELDLHYQPQVDQAGRWISAEALLRWHKSDGTSIGPDAFIPIAEQTGQIRMLDHWVLDRTCADLACWTRQGLTPPRLAINLSSVELERLHGEHSLAVRIQAICARHGVSLDLLTLELTETAIVKDWQEAVTQLQPLVDAGVEVAIDDFGTGYSSLKLLQLLPIHKIKLDKSFVRTLPHSTNDHRIVAGSIQMAQNLGLRVVAEGVESPAQWQCLQALGCDAYQGHLFSQPLSAATFCQRLQGQISPVPAASS